jgi:dihydroflavonol-4-reductase
MSKQVVLITGISGYLGSKCVQHFLNDGTYEVRGTVRSATNEKKVAPLKAAFGDKFSELKLIEADLMNPESMINAIEGCDIVVHTASVFSMEKSFDKVVKPAVEGTRAVLEGCKKHKVKRLVVTSSCVAIHAQAKMKPEWTEDDWSEEAACSIYDLSKTRAEKLCWDFQAALPEGEKFEIVTINPGLILGKYLVKSTFQSADIIYDCLYGKFPKLDLDFCMVDVDDVANAHL